MPESSAPRGLVVAWQRDVPGYDFMNQYSQQHIVRVVDGRERTYTLCGALPRWAYISPGDARRCPRCFAAAKKAGMVDTEYGEPIANEYT